VVIMKPLHKDMHLNALRKILAETTDIAKRTKLIQMIAELLKARNKHDVKQ
jgi:hypothetical protein